MANSKKDVVKKQDQLPAYMNQDQARGSENVSNDDLQLPRLEIIQDLSPQRKKTKDEYIQGAEEGMMFNTLTSELFEVEVYVIPVWFYVQNLAWVDQDAGGGLLGVFDTIEEAEAAAAKSEKPAEAVRTPTNLVLLVDKDGKNLGELMMPMAKSKNKINRKWNSDIRLNGGDRFSRIYKVSTFLDKNSAGQEFYNYVVETHGFVPEDTYHEAEAMYEAMSSGAKVVKPDYEADKAKAKTGESDGSY